METINKTTENCGCGDDCCKPKRNKLWTKIIFFVIVAAALTIVTFRIIANNRKPEAKAAIVTTVPAKPACCDTTQPNICTKVSDPNKPCCPQSKK